MPNKKSQASSVSPLLSNRFPFKDSLEPRRVTSRLKGRLSLLERRLKNNIFLEGTEYRTPVGKRNRIRQIFQPLPSCCDSRLRSSRQCDRNARARGRVRRIVTRTLLISTSLISRSFDLSTVFNIFPSSARMKQSSSPRHRKRYSTFRRECLQPEVRRSFQQS